METVLGQRVKPAHIPDAQDFFRSIGLELLELHYPNGDRSVYADKEQYVQRAREIQQGG